SLQNQRPGVETRLKTWRTGAPITIAGVFFYACDFELWR
ncbi:hypothetical protein PSYMO_37237, partial [Pseudomonas amygdali pv. mori str. 301020]